MKQFRNVLFYDRLAVRSKRIQLSSLILLAVVSFILISNLRAYSESELNLLLYHREYLRLIPLLSIALLFIFYEYATQMTTRAQLEVLRAIPGALTRHYTHLLLTLFRACLAYFICSLLLVFLLCGRTGLNADLTAYLLRSTALYALAIPLIFALLALVLSFWSSRLPSYLSIAVTVFLLSDVNAELLLSMASVNNPWPYHVAELFRFWPADLDWAPLYAYGYPAENKAFYLMLLWLTVLGLILTWLLILGENKQLSLRRRSLAALLPTALVVVAITLYARPFSTVNLSQYSPLNGGSADQLYYGRYAEAENRTADGFEILDYRLSLTFNNAMQAKASLAYRMTGDALPGFTLYHGYRLDRLQLDGEDVSYTQSGDYITLQETLPASGELIFIYTGSAPRFFANNQGVFLPASLSWYPRPGLVPTFDRTNMGLAPVLFQDPLPFTVEINNSGDFICNLEAVGEQGFAGEATGVSLFQGFYAKASVAEMDLYYPYLDPQLDIEQQLAQLAMWKEEGTIGADQRTIIICPQTNLVSIYEQLVMLPDHIIAEDLSLIGDAHEVWSFLPHKYGLWSALDLLKTDRPTFADRVQMIHDSIEVDPAIAGEMKDDIYYRLDGLFVDGADEAGLISRMEDYITDNSDQRTIDEFLTQLEREAAHAQD